MNRLLPLILVSLLFLCSSCARLFFGKDAGKTIGESYDYLTETIDERYSLFDVKDVKWEDAKKEYRALLTDSMTNEDLLNVMGHLVGNLKDGHTNVYGGFNYSRYWDWYLDYPTNFDFEVIERNYLKKNHWRTGPFLHTIIDSVAYVYYGSFSPPISGKNLKHLMDRVRPMKGVIFDIRNNGGGKLNNVKKIASVFADSTRVIHDFYFKTKDGFSEKIPYKIKAQKKRFTKPVIVLTNRKSYSAATFFPSGMAAFPHIKVMGDHTGGGGGIPYFFELPNGWTFRASTTRTIDTKGRNIEPGIPPDIEVHIKPEDRAKGIDSIIEAALDLIRNTKNFK